MSSLVYHQALAGYVVPLLGYRAEQDKVDQDMSWHSLLQDTLTPSSSLAHIIMQRVLASCGNCFMLYSYPDPQLFFSNNVTYDCCRLATKAPRAP